MTPHPFSVPRAVFRGTMIAVAALCFCAAGLACAAAEEVRTWTDNTGKFKVTAKFVEVSDGKVTLEREDGSRVSIPLEKLSEADRKIVAEIQANEQNPFQAVPPPKKAARKKPSAQKPVEDQDESGPDSSDVIKPRWAGVRQVLPAPTNDKWSLSFEVPKDSPPRLGRPIAFPGKRDFFEHVKSLVINPVCRRAALGYILDKGETRVVVCDLDKGEVLAKAKTTAKMSPLALNDTGTEVLMCRAEFGHGSQDRLETWSVTPTGITKVLQWIPHDDQKGGDRDVKWARYVGDGKLVTASGGGKLVLWDAATAKPLYWLKIQGACRPALSPDRKYVAFTTDKEIGVLDLAAGEVVALQATPNQRLNFPVLAFTPKGTRLACGAFDRVYVWDVATGALYREIPLAGAKIFLGENLICPSEEHVLVGNKLLVDIESQARLWTYEGYENVAMLDGVCWFEVIANESGALVPSVLPHPGALETIQKAIESPDFFVLKPGATVTVNVSALPDPAEREKAAAALIKKLQANGCQVGDKGVVELVATAEAGRRREVAFHSFGRPGTRTYMVQEFTSRVKVVYQGQTAWEVATTSVPGFFHLKEGETLEEHLKQSEHPNYEWFSHVELPKVVQKPSSGVPRWERRA